MFSCTDSAKIYVMKTTAVKWLYRHTGRSHARILLTSVLNIFTSLCTVFFSLVMKDLIDCAISGSYSEIGKYSAFIILLTVFQYISFVISQYMQEKTAVTCMSELRQFLISALLQKDYAKVQERHSGQWINLLFSDIKIVSDGVSSIIPGISGMLSRLAFAFITLAILEPVLAVIYLVGGGVILIGVGFFRKKLKNLHRAVQEKEDKVHSLVQEIIENILIIKVFRAEKYFEEITSRAQEDYSAVRIHRKKYRLISVNMFSFAFRMGYVAALIYGVYELVGGRISYGTLTAVLHIVGQMRVPIYNLSGILPKIYEVTGSAERIMAIDTAGEELSDSSIDGFRRLTVKNVSFSYDREEVIKDISLEINRNDIVALTGTSGGGKSTFFLLLLGIYYPDSGVIQIQTDQGVFEPSVQTRQLFAYVPQGNGLFSGTIRENVVFNHEYNAAKLEDALKTADAFDFVSELPEQEETLIGEKGTGLSEGQVQRISIARAVYSDAPVLLLDESTSALDEQTEARVLDNIRKLKNKTVLIVTHRPAALKICTKHLHIDNHWISEVKNEYN